MHRAFKISGGAIDGVKKFRAGADPFPFVSILAVIVLGCISGVLAALVYRAPQEFGYIGIGAIGLVPCLWLISLAVYKAAQKRTTLLFERDRAGSSPKAPSKPLGRPHDVPPTVPALFPTAPAHSEPDSALLPVCLDGDEAKLVGPQVEAPPLHG